MGKSKYEEAHDKFRNEIDRFHDLVHDGFKAPEQIVTETPDLLSAIWELQVSYAAMMREPGEDG